MFFALLIENVEVFLKSEDKRTALISCIAMWPTHSAYQPHTIQVWGIVAFIPIWVFPQPSIDKRNSTPHFLILLTCTFGVGAQKNVCYGN